VRLAALLLALLLLAVAPARGAQRQHVLRYAFPLPETQFDPAQITDLYSRTIAAGIFEAPLEFAFHDRPVRLRPNTAVALPEIGADQRSLVFTIRPGQYFADDPAFGGRKRELVAADYVYALKRHYDPRWKSGQLYQLEGAGLLGLSELRRAALETGRPFDYEREVEGLQVLDRYRFRVRTALPMPRLAQLFADPSFAGAVAREVVEAHGDQIGAHPVGTGPFRLVQWRRGSRIVLERNPGYRERHYDEPHGDPALSGRRLPMLERVEIDIVEQPQPRWLAFLNNEHDLIEQLPAEYATLAAPGGRLAPHLAARGMQMERQLRPSVALTYFAMQDPVIGGIAPPQVALRRAMALAFDSEREALLVRYGMAIPAQGTMAPGVWGYDPDWRSEMGRHDAARAKALLELYGWRDRDGDGWRETPDGAALVIRYATQSDSLSRKLAEQWQLALQAVGLRLQVDVANWPENAKRSRTGQLQMWTFGWLAGTPDGETFLALGYGPYGGQSNPSRFSLPAFDALFDRQHLLPDGPERLATMQQAQRLLIAYMPMKAHVHHIGIDLAQAPLRGYRRHPFVPNFWLWVDVGP